MPCAIALLLQRYVLVNMMEYEFVFSVKMKVKEIDRTANICWSPASQYPIYVATGTAAQQLDATFR